MEFLGPVGLQSEDRADRSVALSVVVVDHNVNLVAYSAPAQAPDGATPHLSTSRLGSLAFGRERWGLVLRLFKGYPPKVTCFPLYC